MFDAQLLHAAASDTTEVYSPWFGRGSDNARFTLDLVDLDSGSKITVEVYHKNADETGDGTLYSGTSIAENGKGRSTEEWTGLREMVRYKFTVQSELPDTASWVLFRMLPPVWFDTVDAS